MTITAPTPEQFLAQQADPEDEDLDGEPISPLDSIADSLRRLVAVAEEHDAEEKAESQLQDQYDELDRAYAVLEEQKEEAWALLGQVLEICKPSTSKLANAIRAAIEPPAVVTTGPGENAEQPANDAPVEEWRGYARSRGYAGPDIDKANRSQIRTMLGIEHPSEVQS